jgi:hypothetical protein
MYQEGYEWSSQDPTTGQWKHWIIRNGIQEEIYTPSYGNVVGAPGQGYTNTTPLVPLVPTDSTAAWEP